jgi:hypothetical protein
MAGGVLARRAVIAHNTFMARRPLIDPRIALLLGDLSDLDLQRAGLNYRSVRKLRENAGVLPTVLRKLAVIIGLPTETLGQIVVVISRKGWGKKL